ncbi:MAG: hypothetical protein AAFV59_17630, partial [Pseudomonadota bacterium]
TSRTGALTHRAPACAQRLSGLGRVLADPFGTAIGQALQFKRIAIDSQDISNRGANTPCASLRAEIVRFGEGVGGAARGYGKGNRQCKQIAHG